MGFVLGDTKVRFRAETKEGIWQKGYTTEDKNITIHEASNVLHYGQGIFEGMKAYKQKNGDVVLFRPDMNFERFNQSASRLMMKEVPRELFFEAIETVVKENLDQIPEYGSGHTLYIRPHMLGQGLCLGVKPSMDYMFSVFGTPVGVYFAGGLQALDFVTTKYDRASAMGTGQVKVAGNYAASLYPRNEALEAGYAGVVYLDPLTHTKIDEVGAANFFGITKDNKLVTPKSSSILPSITKKSILYIAEHVLGMEVEETEVPITSLSDLAEAGACGTAAVITPVASITHDGKKYVIGNGETGPVTTKLYNLLTGIQFGDVEAPEGWIYKVK